MSQTPTQTLPDTDPGLSKSGLDAEERVVRLVMEGIGQHRIPPGHRLVERELTEGAHANRQAVRNALLRLSQAGLVQLTPNRGATVMQCTPDMTRQIMQARIINEGAALRMLAPRLDEAGSGRLQQILRNEASAYDEGRISEARHFSRQFHIAFTEMAGNEMIARFMRELIACQPLLAAWDRDRPSSFSGVIAHTKTLAALQRGDGAEAEAANTELLCALEREFLRESAERDVGGRARGTQ
ncbi:FCD domain-containing protein [Paracoccus kondratievae]|uniref:Transcriptional regulator n=1 Tax=Paracoccus kondratievae TaxID=135740 RepID=A0AAD3RUX8_9RHOB|nr:MULTISPECIES: GntR family transcriptional regulator [Paracoccus]QFQ89179.1 FCD domain-containing protein [Paracoccus kondratievae]GLK65114.1 transcriptional regulator [Paracoccus kondratievae]SMG33959.1 DNA-binding transcriptional regulator, GntR family [Paracoccus sp. J56]